MARAGRRGSFGDIKKNPAQRFRCAGPHQKRKTNGKSTHLI
nr:MAG TPA: hypothetical protein [Caudoviricetes sp.]DAP79799.1 MAG TPA: hypothetical protein [Caudoviricetes sp.]